MKIQHLTLGGNSMIRDTADILPETRKDLKILSLDYESQTVSIPKFPFRVKITAAEQGATFDLNRGEDLITTNICCFGGHDEMLMDMVGDLAEKFRMKPVQPSESLWLYTILINPFGLDSDLLMTAGEVELYIYNELYNAKR